MSGEPLSTCLLWAAINRGAISSIFIFFLFTFAPPRRTHFVDMLLAWLDRGGALRRAALNARSRGFADSHQINDARHSLLLPAP